MNEEKKHKFTSSWITATSEEYGLEDSNYYKHNPHYIFTKQFEINSTSDAVIYIAAFGLYICKINGMRISKDELNSDWTDYSKQLYYDTVNVSKFLKVGVNTIEIEVGNGMSNPSPMKLFGKYNLRQRLSLVANPQLMCELIVNQVKVIGTNPSWNLYQGNMITNNYYIGEHVDLRKDVTAKLKTETSRLLVDIDLIPSFIEKNKRQFELEPKSIISEGDKLIVDFGKTIAGFIDFEIKSKTEKQISIRYAETIDEGELNLKSAVVGNVGMTVTDFQIDGGLGAAEVPYQQDIFELAIGDNKYTNKFIYHSFRYAEISGIKATDIKLIKAIGVYTDLEQKGKVATDNRYLNDLFNAATNTKLNNIHSVFEDCARERLAYGGDMIALSASNGYLLDIDKMYRKTINDFRIEQTINGGIPETAPYMGIQTNGTGDGEGPILWQLVYPYLTLRHYQLYGDIKLLEEEYQYLQLQLKYLVDHDYEYLATRCIGDHGSPEILGEFHSETPDKLFVGYATIGLFIKTNIAIAKALNKPIDNLQNLYDQLVDIIEEKFKNKDGSFGNKTQTSYAFALKLGFGDRTLLKKQLEEKLIADNYIITAGIFGAAFLYEELHKLNLDYIVENWLMQESEISFKAMLANGNQVLSELFVSKGNKYYSCNHAMFSSYQSWYFEALAGITVSEEAIGFNKIIINPYFGKSLNSFKSIIKTEDGNIKVNWSRIEDKIIYKAIIPRHITCSIVEVEEYAITKRNLSPAYYQIEIEL